MTELPSPEALLARCRRALRPRKGLGQRFLTNVRALERIARAVEADARTLVLEIGPGPGTLTTLLAATAGGVLGVERDARLKDFHLRVFAGRERVRFIYADALRLDLAAEARRQAAAWGLGRMALAGNLPFQITSPLLFAQCRPDAPWDRMVLMVQREVAGRIASAPGGRDYGALAVKLGYWWRVVDRFEVAAAEFRPRPKVAAAVLTFEPAAEGRPSAAAWPKLSRFIDLAFNQRRKMLRNSPAAARLPGDGKFRLARALESLGLDVRSRPQDLSPGDYLRLVDRLRSSGADGEAAFL